MNLLELLRTQARRYRCPVCSSNMSECEIAVLMQQGNRALVRVTCTACSDENLLQIVLQDAGQLPLRPTRARRIFDETRPIMREPIDADEMLDLHEMLGSHKGDFSELLGIHRVDPPEEPSNGSPDAPTGAQQDDTVPSA